jgi:hypothetical protein
MKYVVPRKGFILEPGSCSRRCSTAAIVPASAGGACAGTQNWSGQHRRREGRPGAGLGGQVINPTERRRVRCRSGSPAGSDRERERAETRVSSLEDAKCSEKAGGASRFRRFR